MNFENFIKNMSSTQKNISNRIFNIALKRIFKKIYLEKNEMDKAIMESIFLNGTNEEKDDFFKNNFLKFEDDFKKEISKISEEIKAEISNKSV